MKRFAFERMVAFNLDAGGGAGAGSGGDGGAPGAQGAQGGAPGGGGNAPPADLAAAAAAAAAAAGVDPQNPEGKSYLPDGLAETYRGATDRETIDKLAADVSKLPKPPATAKDYKFEAPKEFADKFGDMADDPIIPMWGEIAHELGLSNEQFSAVVPKLYEKMAKAGLIEGPPDWQAEFAKLAPKDGDAKQKAQAVQLRINNITSLVQGLETRGEITKADALVLSAMWVNADAVLAFEKVLKNIPKQHGPQGGGERGGGAAGGDPLEAQALKMFPSHVKQQN